ncbi:NAD(P)H-dependent oxidoreductase [Otoolea muris]|uniref:NAD(P)H-dependent oxidoreductase n=1 Tax=Otoolea muris TaxID=2941515 RepID=UPI00203EB720|nr:NAD(P)H-dependent oxidoreductase [Otoolea muris]
MKILILNGSPKQNSSTLVLTWEFMKGVNENNEHQIESVNIVEKKSTTARGVCPAGSGRTGIVPSRMI